MIKIGETRRPPRRKLNGWHMAFNGPAILEVEQIDGLLEAAGTDGVREIMSAFWRSSDALTLGLSTHLDTEDTTGAARTAHALKGSAANVGACQLADCARLIEDHCKSGDLQAAKEALVKLSLIYQETRAAVESHLISQA